MYFAITKNGKVAKLLGKYYELHDYRGENRISRREIHLDPKSVRLKLATGDKVAIKFLYSSTGTGVAFGFDLDPEDLDLFNEFIKAKYEITSFAEFSGYKIK